MVAGRLPKWLPEVLLVEATSEQPHLLAGGRGRRSRARREVHRTSARERSTARRGISKPRGAVRRAAFSRHMWIRSLVAESSVFAPMHEDADQRARTQNLLIVG